MGKVVHFRRRLPQRRAKRRLSTVVLIPVAGLIGAGAGLYFVSDGTSGATAAGVECLSLSAVDGDTIKCNGQNMRIMGPGVPFKSGIDTPEIRNAKCAREKLLGEQAKNRLAELLREDVRIDDSGERDRYGRPLVWVRMPNGSTAGEILLRDGYAARWQPGYQSSWCE